MKIRNNKRKKLAEKRGCKSVGLFRVGDPVRVQDPRSKEWLIRGTIQEIRHTQDGTQSDFNIRKTNGKMTLRHISHVRHDVTLNNRAVPSKVSFREMPKIRPITRLIMTIRRARELSQKEGFSATGGKH